MKDNILHCKLVINNQYSSQGWAVAQGHSHFVLLHPPQQFDRVGKSKLTMYP